MGEPIVQLAVLFVITDLFHLTDILYEEPANLTNSTKQKVAIASALIHKPKILLLDESLHQLTEKDKKIVFDAINYYKKNYNLTIILITHNEEDTLSSDRIIVLNNQKIYLDGSVKDVYKEERKLKTLGINIPFIIKLSLNLNLYDLIDEIYLTDRALIDKLW